MGRYAIIETGVVTNVIVADAAFVAQLPGTVIQSNTASVGDLWNGTTFTAVASENKPPKEVSMDLFVRALDAIGISENNVDSVISAMPGGNEKQQVKIWWNRAPVARRKNEQLKTLTGLLGLTNAQVKDLFYKAESLTDIEQ